MAIPKRNLEQFVILSNLYHKFPLSLSVYRILYQIFSIPIYNFRTFGRKLKISECKRRNIFNKFNKNFNKHLKMKIGNKCILQKFIKLSLHSWSASNNVCMRQVDHLLIEWSNEPWKINISIRNNNIGLL